MSRATPLRCVCVSVNSKIIGVHGPSLTGESGYVSQLAVGLGLCRTCSCRYIGYLIAIFL
jgi:hypothetical protein